MSLLRWRGGKWQREERRDGNGDEENWRGGRKGMREEKKGAREVEITSGFNPTLTA